MIFQQVSVDLIKHISKYAFYVWHLAMYLI